MGKLISNEWQDAMKKSANKFKDSQNHMMNEFETAKLKGFENKHFGNYNSKLSFNKNSEEEFKRKHFNGFHDRLSTHEDD